MNDLLLWREKQEQARAMQHCTNSGDELAQVDSSPVNTPEVIPREVAETI